LLDFWVTFLSIKVFKVNMWSACSVIGQKSNLRWMKYVVYSSKIKKSFVQNLAEKFSATTFYTYSTIIITVKGIIRLENGGD
jgi:hypothetical protein